MQQDNIPCFRYCIVPLCKNTNRNAPNKVFFLVPRGMNIRKKWCKIMKRDMISPTTCLYCCEDHFDLEEDTSNYIQYKIMNLQENHRTVLRLKKGILPHKFQCQIYTEPQTTSERQAHKKKKHLKVIEAGLLPGQQCVSTLKLTEISQIDDIEASSSPVHTEDIEIKNIICEVGCSTLLSFENKMYVDKAFEVNSKVCHRSKGVNFNLCPKKNNTAVSPLPIYYQ